MQFINPVSHQAPKKSSSTSPCHPFCHSPQESKQGASSDLSPRKAGPWNPSLASGPFYVLTAGPALQVLAGTEVEGILSPNFTLGMRVYVARTRSRTHAGTCVERRPGSPVSPPVAHLAGVQELLPLMTLWVLVAHMVCLQSQVDTPVCLLLQSRGTGEQAGMTEITRPSKEPIHWNWSHVSNLGERLGCSQCAGS